MTIEGLSRTGATAPGARPVEPWVDLGDPDRQTGAVCGSVRIVDQGDRTVRFGPQEFTTAKGGVVAVDAWSGRFTYIPSASARQVSGTSTHYPDTVDTFTIDIVDAYGTRAEAHVVVDIRAETATPGAASTLVGSGSAECLAEVTDGVKTNTILGVKEVQWCPITVDNGSAAIVSTSGGTASLDRGPAGDYTLTFTSSGGSFFSQGPAGSVVVRVTDPQGLHTDRTYVYRS